MPATRSFPVLFAYIALIGTGILPRSSFCQVVYTHQVTIQPIQVGRTSPSELANISVYFAESQKVWDQAGVFLNWLPFNQFIDTNYYNIGNPTYLATFDNLTTYPATTGGSSNPTVINMWFVHDLRSDGTPQINLGGTTFGGSIVIDNEGIALKHVVPHELGHALLGDANHTYAAGNPSNLMHASPTVPTLMSQIGTSHLLLDSVQITQALSSGYVSAVPEPSHYAAVASATVLFVAFLRRRLRP